MRRRAGGSSLPRGCARSVRTSSVIREDGPRAATLRSGEGLRDLPAAVDEGASNVLQVVIREHFAGKRDPDGQDAVLDRFPREDLTLLVKTEKADGREIDVHPRGQPDA